jgi:hypothetical protein
VRHIFTRYLELASVHALERELADQGIVSSQRVTRSGKTVGGVAFSRGSLFHLLRSPIYIGRIPHKGITHEGGHEAIVGQDLFNQVQERLDRQARRHRSKGERRVVRAPLVGRLFDAAGQSMSPTFCQSSSGRTYRYYVSAPLQQGRKVKNDEVRRLPAPAFEKLVGEVIERWLPFAGPPLDLPLAIRLQDHGFLIDMPGRVASEVATRLGDGETILHSTPKECRIVVRCPLPLRGGKRLIVPGSRSSSLDRSLIAALRKAHRMVTLRSGLPCLEAVPLSRYDREILRLAFLAPKLQRDILAGHQPRGICLERLRHMDIPPCWKEQRRALGWPEES